MTLTTVLIDCFVVAVCILITAVIGYEIFEAVRYYRAKKGFLFGWSVALAVYFTMLLAKLVF
jgi:hypothetical protein